MTKMYAVMDTNTNEIVTLGRRPYYHRRGDAQRQLNEPWNKKKTNYVLVEATLGEWTQSD